MTNITLRSKKVLLDPAPVASHSRRPTKRTKKVEMARKKAIYRNIVRHRSEGVKAGQTSTQTAVSLKGAHSTSDVYSFLLIWFRVDKKRRNNLDELQGHVSERQNWSSYQG